jgi:ABC-2 type transport system ATP-binding protein
MWDTIKQLAESGTTILLTTQDMDEADHLASRIVVLNGGKIIAEGTSDELKQQVGSERLEITFINTSYFEKAKEIIQVEKFHADNKTRTISFVTTGGVHQLRQVLSQLEEENIEVENVSFHGPTLDDVFLILTGHSTEHSNIEGNEKEVFKQ